VIRVFKRISVVVRLIRIDFRVNKRLCLKSPGGGVGGVESEVFE